MKNKYLVFVFACFNLHFFVHLVDYTRNIALLVHKVAFYVILYFLEFLEVCC